VLLGVSEGNVTVLDDVSLSLWPDVSGAHAHRTFTRLFQIIRVTQNWLFI
jgi:hypothetical protein